MVRKFLVLALGVLGSVGVGGCDPTVPEIDCNSVTPKKYSELSIIEKCTNCHSSKRMGEDRHNATPGYDYDTYEGTVQTGDEAQADIAGAGLNEMPPTDQVVDDGGPPPTVSDAEKQDFYAWYQCGQPN